MAYNEFLADRIRRSMVSQKAQIEEKKMFGGLTFMLKGKMCCGIVKDELMVRIIENKYDEALKDPHARPMDFTNRPMKGFLFISPEGFDSEEDLERWVGMGVEYVESLE